MKNIKQVVLIIISIIISIPVTLKLQFNVFSSCNLLKINIFLLLLIALLLIFIFSHLIFKIKDIYNFLFKNRYLISLFILLLLVLGKINGSSIELWNEVVEPNNKIETTIIGKGIHSRSDEWVVNTPYAISQKYNNYNYFSNLPRATKTDMFSTIFVPVKDILILTRPFNIGYLLLGEEYGLSFYWYGRLIALFLVTFEFMLLITNKKKLLSLAGTILLVGSPLVSWFYSNYIVDLLISGQLCLLMFNNYLKTKNIKTRIIYSIIIGLSFSWFTLTIYPAWQIPLGYMYLIFAIWIFINNLKNNKSIKEYLLLLIPLFIILILLLRYYYLSKDTLKIILSTVYPGKRIITGGGEFIFHFIYPISIFFGYSDYHNPCEAAGVYSLFPIPIIVSIIYLLKQKTQKKKNNNNLLILLLSLLAIFFTIYTFISIPTILSKITLLYMCPVERIAPIIGIICLYLLILTTDKINIKNNNKKVILLFITIITSYIIVKIGSLDRIWYLTSKRLIISLVLLAITIYLYINSNKKRNAKILSIILIIIGLLNICLVNPINIGTKVLHQKESAKAIRKIIKKDKSTWLAINSIELGNYVLANGGKVINSTNIYPNIELYKKLDKNNKYNKIYNRYAHVKIKLVERKTSFKLIQNDYIEIDLNYDDIYLLNAKYLISNKKLTIPNNYKETIKQIYNNDNIFIYKKI